MLRSGGSSRCPFSISGQPAISLPLHWTTDSLPVGVQLVADYGREDLLLRISARLEEALPWHHRRAPVLPDATPSDHDWSRSHIWSRWGPASGGVVSGGRRWGECCS